MTPTETYKKVEAVIQLAKEKIQAQGWVITENIYTNGTHLVLEKNGERRGWGVLDRFTCWSEAYSSISGAGIETLKV